MTISSLKQAIVNPGRRSSQPYGATFPEISAAVKLVAAISPPTRSHTRTAVNPTLGRTRCRRRRDVAMCRPEQQRQSYDVAVTRQTAAVRGCAYFKRHSQPSPASHGGKQRIVLTASGLASDSPDGGIITFLSSSSFSSSSSSSSLCPLFSLFFSVPSTSSSTSGLGPARELNSSQQQARQPLLHQNHSPAA